MHSPTRTHLDAFYKVLKYLKDFLGHGLFFKKTETRGIYVFIYADWAGLIKDRRSANPGIACLPRKLSHMEE